MTRTTTASRVLGALLVVWVVPAMITFIASWRTLPITRGIPASMVNGLVLAGPPLLLGGVAWLLLHRCGRASVKAAAISGAVAGGLWFAAASAVWRYGELSRGVDILATLTHRLVFAGYGLAMLAIGAAAGLLVWWIAYGTMGVASTLADESN